VLAALRRAGTPYELSPGRLLKETLVTSGTMTNRVDRLAARGLVERLPDPRDRRGVLVRLTPAGRSAVDGALEGLLARERSLLAGLDADDQRRLAGLLRTLVVPFEGEAR
jgi:DNA-binding MarR family transcriptional regulator